PPTPESLVYPALGTEPLDAQETAETERTAHARAFCLRIDFDSLTCLGKVLRPVDSRVRVHRTWELDSRVPRRARSLELLPNTSQLRGRTTRRKQRPAQSY